jgi:hypothetical protein
MPDNPVDPCFIGDNVMWTTDSADVMNASHFATHSQFYAGKLQPDVQCISNTNSTTQLAFGYAQQN